MDLLPPELIEAYLPCGLLRLVSKEYYGLLSNELKKPWVFDGVLVDTLKCVNPYDKTWIRISREYDTFMGWVLRWGNSAKSHSMKFAPHKMSSFTFTHEYSFKAIANILMSSLKLDDSLVSEFVDDGISSYNSTDRLRVKGLCIYKGKCEYVMDALISEKSENDPIIYLPNIIYHNGPLMKGLPKETLLSIDKALDDLHIIHGSNTHAYYTELEVIHSHVPDCFDTKSVLYRYSNFATVRFKVELENLDYLGDNYLKEVSSAIIKRMVIEGFTVGLVCIWVNTLPKLYLID